MRGVAGVASILLFVPVTAGLAQAKRVLRVPADFAKVQTAIDSAKEGDTVLVAPGRYYENLVFKGQNIVLASEFARTRDRSAIERTILDGSRPAHPDSGAVVTIWRFEDSTAVVEGFTITGGTGTVWFDNKDKINFREGGGIIVDLAGPTIRNNIIEGNVAIDKGKMLSAGGGGIRVGFAEPIIERNVIRNNKGRYGGGVVLFHSAATLRNNVITGNEGGEDFGGADQRDRTQHHRGQHRSPRYDAAAGTAPDFRQGSRTPLRVQPRDLPEQHHLGEYAGPGAELGRDATGHHGKRGAGRLSGNREYRCRSPIR